MISLSQLNATGCCAYRASQKPAFIALTAGKAHEDSDIVDFGALNFRILGRSELGFIY